MTDRTLVEKKLAAILLDVNSELGGRFASEGKAKMELFDYMEGFYRQRRRHSSAGRMTPAAFECRLTHTE